MIFHFQTNDVTFFEEDRAYFEKRLLSLKKILGWESGDEDTVDVHIKIEKNKHHGGDRFEASANVVAPHGGKFYTSISADTIRKCADILQSKLKAQIKTFHEKKK